MSIVQKIPQSGSIFGKANAQGIVIADPTWYLYLYNLSLAVGSYFTPVAWDGVNDRVLGVGQITQDSFTSATSMPLHIACGDGQIYEIDLNGTFTPTALGAVSFLYLNNGTVSGTFRRYYQRTYGASTSSTANDSSAATGFQICYGSSVYNANFRVSTSTLTKSFYGFSKGENTTGGIISQLSDIEWLDTTTPYSSLGTITMPNAWTGQVVVKRIA